MKTLTLLTGLAALALSGAAGAQPRADTNGDGALSRAEFSARLDQRFARLDVNRDGRLTREDRQARRAADPQRAERRAARLGRFDTNRDGQLSPAERQVAKAQRQAERAGRHGGHTGPRRDANGDRAVTRAEFQAWGLQRFAALDTNRDGQLTKVERQAGRALRGHRAHRG